MKIKVISLILLVIGFAGFLWIGNSGSSQLSAKTLLFQTAQDSSINWENMDHSERMGYMKKVILPTMRVEFAKFNPDKFAKINCKTCHGAGAEDDSYKMPNPQIFKLPRTKEGWAKADTNFMKFMRFTVKPKMAELLGLQPYDKDHQNGFGCGNCHTDEK